MTVEQVGRTTNSVTINVSGITEGDRQTWIWEPKTGEWYTLQDAYQNGFIQGFDVADFADNNGDIKIYVSDEFNGGVLITKVENLNTSTGNWDVLLSCVLGFEYENNSTKYAGDLIDITVRDMQIINIFGSDIDFFINDGDGTYYPLDGAESGDEIKGEYLSFPAQNIWNAAYNNRELLGDYYYVVWNYTSDIMDNCVSGADFKALWFNGIKYAINNFNMSITV